MRNQILSVYTKKGTVVVKMDNMETQEDKETIAKQAALRLVAGCLRNARSNQWLAEYEKEVITILGTWMGLSASLDAEDSALAQEIYEQHLKDQNDIKAEASRQKRCQEETAASGILNSTTQGLRLAIGAIHAVKADGYYDGENLAVKKICVALENELIKLIKERGENL
jgi:hypothetical protein